jgi:3-deoxy-manno-octulosonate cytidylyltransferase (CMP-KDO synthetase)
MNTEQSPQVNAVVVIPARFASTRLPGKPLLTIGDRPMILHVVERALKAKNVRRVVVATDDERVFDVVMSAGYEAVITSERHQSGSDRVAEVAAMLEGVDIIVNVQGDEPLVSHRTIERVIDELLNADEAEIVTACEAIVEIEDVLSPDVVKVVRDEGYRALYFSRSPIPFSRDAVKRHGTLEAALRNEPLLLSSFLKHSGIYAYRRGFLLEYSSWPQTPLERLEALEQLRALERGVSILVIDSDAPSIGVDTEQDLERVRAIFSGLE